MKTQTRLKIGKTKHPITRDLAAAMLRQIRKNKIGFNRWKVSTTDSSWPERAYCVHYKEKFPFSIFRELNSNELSKCKY